MATIKYFGVIAEATQCSEEQMTIDGLSVSGLLELLNTKYDLKGVDVRVALNQSLVDQNSEKTIGDNDELALLPPFAGG